MQTQGCGGSFTNRGYRFALPSVIHIATLPRASHAFVLAKRRTNLSMVSYTFSCFARFCSCITTILTYPWLLTCETRVIHYPWKRFVFPILCFALLLIIGIQWILIPCDDIIIRRAFVVFEVGEHCRFHRNVEIV